MKPDPSDQVHTHEARIPPATGPGSGKDAWRALALKAIDANDRLSTVIDEQSQALRDARADIELLRRQIATRRPPGCRDPLPDDKVARIESAIRTGESTRSIARGYGVSAMTVSRVAKRMRTRDALSA